MPKTATACPRSTSTTSNKCAPAYTPPNEVIRACHHRRRRCAQHAGVLLYATWFLAAVEEFPHIPVVMHQDHGASPDVCQRSIQLSYASEMDGLACWWKTAKPLLLHEYNANATRTVVNLSHACGASVEAKSACWATSKLAKSRRRRRWRRRRANFPTTKPLTTVEDAAQFPVKDTSHADDTGHCRRHQPRRYTTRPPSHDGRVAYRPHQKNPPSPAQYTHRDARLQLRSARMTESHQRIVGGNIGETSRGAPNEEIVDSTKHGARKVNIDTRLCALPPLPATVTPIPCRKPVRTSIRANIWAKTIEAMKQICLDPLPRVSAAKRQAGKIKPHSFEKMANRYAKGELNQTVKQQVA